MPQKIRMTTNRAAFSRLEKTLSGQGPVNRQKRALFVSIVDEDGREITLDQMQVAYALLLAGGHLNHVLEIEKQTGIKPALQGDATARIFSQQAATGAYSCALRRIRENLSSTGLQRLFDDLYYIRKATGISPSQEIHDKVFSAIAKSDGIARTMIVKYYLSRMDARPSPEAAQNLYSSTLTLDKDSLKRLRSLYDLILMPPTVGGREVTIDEFFSENAARLRDQNPEELLFAKGVLDNIGRGEPNYSKIVSAYETFAAHREPLSEASARNLPEAYANYLSEFYPAANNLHIEGVMSGIDAIVQSGIYTVDVERFQAAISERIKSLHDEYSRTKFPAGAHKLAIRRRCRNLLELANHLSVPLTEETRSHLYG